MKKQRDVPGDSNKSKTRHTGRRKALKALAAGGGVVALSQWTKPVIETAVLPAHAQATGGFTGNFAGALASPVLPFARNWLDLLVPQAAAGGILPTCGADAGQPICINITNNSVDVQVNTGAGVLVTNATLVGGSFNAVLGGVNGTVTGTLNGAQTQVTGQVSMDCTQVLESDGGAFIGEPVRVASLQLAGVVQPTVSYPYTANIDAICTIALPG